MQHTQSGRAALSVLIIAIMVVGAGLGIYLWSHTHRTPVTVRGIAGSPTIIPDTGKQRFSDGLGTPDASTTYPLDEFGAGVARRDIFMRDINNDGHADRITRTRVENGTDHYYDDYKIELYTGNAYRDITPDNMRTIESADCALRRFQFVFRPTWRIIEISRPWRDTWITPTMATRSTYRLVNGQIRRGISEPVKEICNVADLF